ncbi:crosslink repair DNA glycosylase YcaQ family protein [Streptomyces sp. NPDC051183]|uniref:DNA glycosylase AlkZ-like family protein n=1 Tax=Streptomyces sp. NPDC051183 TaxID=3155165 RepID=UPI003422BAB4
MGPRHRHRPGPQRRPGQRRRGLPDPVRKPPRPDPPPDRHVRSRGLIRRGRPLGSWVSSRFRWARAAPHPDVSADDARLDLCIRYLRSFGPSTTEDLKWWTGWTREAGAAVAAEAARLTAFLGEVASGPACAPPVERRLADG